MSSVVASEERTERNPDATRARILEAAFQEIHLKGFQGMRLDEVLRTTGLTKGALYYHFPNKMALGYAVVDEVIYAIVESMWREALELAEDPIQAMIDTLRDEMTCEMAADVILRGCPLNNLAQEMSPLDEGFRQRLDAVFEHWSGWIVDALKRGQEAGKVRHDVDPQATSMFLIAAMEGCVGMAKNAQSMERLLSCTSSLMDYLDKLRS